MRTSSSTRTRLTTACLMGSVALDQNVNDDLAMGTPPGAPWANDAAQRTRANTLTVNTRNMTRKHYHHHGHAHWREELTPRAVLA
ncbi:hypothetical protein DFH11DRAFT_1600681, partial [Phellopilus nigrolimitatus]